MFNVYSEHIISQAELDQLSNGVRIGGRKINILRYADDTTLLAENADELQDMINAVMNISAKYGLQLNLSKTKVMCIGDDATINVNNQSLHLVTEFKFLGSLVHKDGYIKHEIRRRIGLGKVAMVKLTKLMRDSGISRKTKISIVKSLVFPVVLYGSESWTLHKEDKTRLDRFELWAWRKMLRVSWKDKRTNASILEEVNPGKSLTATAIENKLIYFGHLLRRAESLEKDLMIGITEGSRKRGRRRLRWSDEIIDTLKMEWAQIIRLAESRPKWRAAVQQATQSITRSNVRLAT